MQGAHDREQHIWAMWVPNCMRTFGVTYLSIPRPLNRALSSCPTFEWMHEEDNHLQMYEQPDGGDLGGRLTLILHLFSGCLSANRGPDMLRVQLREEPSCGKSSYNYG